MNFQNSSALVTGGSRGLGRALGLELARAGARVVLVARRPDRLEEAVREIQDRGGTAYGIAADIADKDAVHAIAGEAAALVGPIDILIQNASDLGPVPLRLLADTDCEDLERALAVNVVGPFRLQKIIAGSMALRGRGLVISVTSDAGVEAYPSWGAYGASKAALEHMTRTWAAELGESGVRFLAIDPGEMDTGMHAAAMPDVDPSTLADPIEAARRMMVIMRDAQHQPNGARI